ncbi:hypothetical protein BOTNAR_0177g00090 [Botryotinia narcissicola]|uniref:Uncharacterized protein n=1 Tax=Botryotinia narcissicola TaxID=278944 RepID=A0A4Z1IPN2_9HELO|nr:hypothetical protein BOTNAR_0177g00090 [Botryotinia narcissicola]
MIKPSKLNKTIRSEKGIKDLLRHIARSLGQVLEHVENQESFAGNTVGTSIAVALAPVTPFDNNQMA